MRVDLHLTASICTNYRQVGKGPAYRQILPPLALERKPHQKCNYVSALSCRLGAQSPFPLSGHVSADVAFAHAPALNLQTNLSGTLMRLSAAVHAQMNQLNVEAVTNVKPFDSTPIESVTAHSTDIDLSQWIEGAPRYHAKHTDGRTSNRNRAIRRSHRDRKCQIRGCRPPAHSTASREPASSLPCHGNCA